MNAATTVYPPRPGKRFADKVVKYRPLLLGLIVVAAGTYLVALLTSIDGMVSTHQLMNVFMGVFFLVFAIPKLFNLTAFADTFKQYDIISKRSYSYARAYPFIELTLGLVLLSGVTEMTMPAAYVVNTIIVLMTGVTLIGVLSALRRKEQLDCACMGTAFQFPLSKVAVVENGLMLIMALSMIFTASSAPMAMVSLTHFQVMH